MGERRRGPSGEGPSGLAGSAGLEGGEGAVIDEGVVPELQEANRLLARGPEVDTSDLAFLRDLDLNAGTHTNPGVLEVPEETEPRRGSRSRGEIGNTAEAVAVDPLVAKHLLQRE